MIDVVTGNATIAPRNAVASCTSPKRSSEHEVGAAVVIDVARPRPNSSSRMRPSVPKAVFRDSEIGPDLFLQACKFGLEGMVSKRRDRPYRAGRSPDWIKVKNRSHPSLARVKEAFS